MAIKILKEVSRDGGRLPATGATVIAGMAIELATADTVQPFTAVATTSPLGLASDSNVYQPLQGAGGLTIGVGYDYTNFNRGGLIGAFLNGGAFELWNDSTGNPFVLVPTTPYALNKALYANNAGLITADAAGAMLVGYCMKIVNAGDASKMRLQIKLVI